MNEYRNEKEYVILVDKYDNKIGTCEKMKAHLEGKLHRAFSIFIINSNKEILLQKRALAKYHSGGLWTNACCSHPRDFETVENAAHRRMSEELGINCELKEIFSFFYKVKLDNDLYEHEYDHVFLGKFDGMPRIDPNEVDSCIWMNTEELQKSIECDPTKFTFWFKLVINAVLVYMGRTDIFDTILQKETIYNKISMS